MPFISAATILQNLISHFRNPEETSLIDLVSEVPMGMVAGGQYTWEAPPRIPYMAMWDAGWTGNFVDLDTSIKLENVKRRIANGMTPEVLKRLEVKRISIKDEAIFGDQDVLLPLVEAHRVAIAEVKNKNFSQREVHPYYRLATNIEQSYLMLYGYIIASNGSISAITQADAQAEDFLVRIEQGNLEGQTADSVIVMAMVEFVFCHPKADFEPFGAAYMARSFPLVSCWSSRPIDEIHCEIEFVRPDESPHTDMYTNAQGKREMYVSFYTERNYEEEISLLNDPLRALWHNLFDHYRLDSKGTAEVEAVSDREFRDDTTHRIVHIYVNEHLDPVTGTHVPAHVVPQVTPVVKLKRQGTFDNMHMAPAMDHEGEQAFMAPLCQHDCMHMHWRWSSAFWDVHLCGWSADWPVFGGPNRDKGAPMIPPNQVVSIEPLSTESGVIYKATARKVDFGNRPASQQWHVFCHHGWGYVTELAWKAKVADVIPLSWNAAGYHWLRYVDVNGDPVTRIDESTFPSFEDM